MASNRASLSTMWAVASMIAIRDFKAALSYRLSFVTAHVAGVGAIVLFYFVSKVIGTGGAFPTPQAYFQFIIVGMGLAGLVEVAVSATMGSARGDQVQGTLEALAALPVGSATLGLGWLMYPIVDALIGFVVVFLMAWPLGLSVDPNWPALVLAIVLSLAVFASFGFLGAAIVLAFQQGSGVVPLGLAVISAFSGVLFPVSVMPGWLQFFASLSPLKHALDAMRGALLQHGSIAELSDSFLILVGFAVVLLPLSLFALELGLRRARKTGGLNRY